ncbi:phosphate starvation-inducible protein PhoH, ATPase [Agrilactobacillus composti DSM 18527 = JCM 14202]|uniref:PhoH-like protein n=1 Tax=Agrilactobacillus composti DSM 18527 = JCM 14202 TaxID=1423734 RepID=X0PTW1_9LACO|nr:phosphate starvation-inducible protein PhoH, ATPase [Agrilactobacillus composti DSM 18527 = JCM 14202]GAF40796.1 phosphate starvation-inducible protein PhoH, predicted ATPase [Agrilactobacillus composti DSM 18527 = JCM 14202]
MTETLNAERTFEVPDATKTASLLGVNDQYLTLIEEGLNVVLHPFGPAIKISGKSDQVDQGYAVLDNLYKVLEKGISISSADVVSALKMATKGTLEYFQDFYNQEIITDARHRAIRVKNLGQRRYVDSIDHNDITFGIGPAGTGKTYIAVAKAVLALKKGQVQRLILTRPAVEAGENLGFLPGDLKEKVDPYLRPVYDALYAIMGQDQTNRLVDRGTIEIAPLAYMRGRTLEEAFVILDEAQNTTPAQMKMFLTRLGFDSKMVINGDITQIDLPHNQKSGLVEAQQILTGVSHIGFVEFTANDVVRHPVVASIIAAYADQDLKRQH